MTTGAHSGDDDRGQASTLFCWRRSCWRTFDPQGSYAERGRPMTTGAQDVTTVETSFNFVFLEEEELLEDL